MKEKDYLKETVIETVISNSESKSFSVGSVFLRIQSTASIFCFARIRQKLVKILLLPICFCDCEQN